MMNAPDSRDGCGRKRSLLADNRNAVMDTNGSHHYRPHQQRRHQVPSFSDNTSESSVVPIKDRLQPDTVVKITFGSDDVNEPRFILAYWSIRGLGAPLRAMLSASRISHWVALYDVNEKQPDGWDKSSYLRDKEWLQRSLTVS